jgi:carbon storage regulator
MLVLTRRVGEEIVLPSCGVTIGVIRVGGTTVRLGITAPQEVPIHRREVAAKIEGMADQTVPVGSAAPDGEDALPAGPLERLAEALQRRIERRVGRRIRDLRVEAAEGRIVIHGAAPSYYTRQLVCAAILDGFPSLDDHLVDAIHFDIHVAPQ